jgi:hypothetical protein
MEARYCIACGSRLAEHGAFCANCGRPVRETARVSTSQANVQVPPPPHSHQTGAYYSGYAGGSVGQAERVRTGYYWAVFVVLAILALLTGDNGTLTSFIGLIIATIWVYRDARTRGMEGAGVWAAGTFLLLIVVFPLYFFKRRPRV